MHCIGLFQKSPGKNFLLMQDSSVKASDPMRIVHLLLDHKSAALTSPFYSHQLLCEPLGEEDEEEEDGEKKLVKWESSEFRIKVKEDEGSFANAVRDILRKTFFPLLLKTSQCENWQKELFPWEVYQRGLSYRYVSEFSPKEWSRKSLKRQDFWREFGRTYKHLIDPVIKSLTLTKNSLVENDLDHLYGILDLWNTQPHFTGYLRHRLLEIHQVCILQSTLSSVLSLASLNIGVIHDLYQLHLLLVAFSSPEKKEEKGGEFHDIQRLLLQTLDGGRLLGVFRVYLAHNFRVVDGMERGVVRRWVIEKFLWPLLLTVLQKNGQTSKSSFLPVTKKTLLYYYDRLFGIRRLENIQAVQEEGEEHQRGLLEFDERDDDEIIEYCLAQKTPQKWMRVERGGDERKPYFLLRLREEEILMEEQSWRFWCLNYQWETRVISLDLPVLDWQKDFDSLPQEDQMLYDFRLSILPLSVRELKEEKDLPLIMEMLYENIFQSCILMPNGSEYTKERLTRGFEERREAGEMEGLNLKKFQLRLHTPQTISMRAGTPPSLLILVDAHLFSLQEMHRLQEWITRRAQNVKRLVVVGCIDIINLSESGQVFLDLIQWKEESFIKNRVYQFSNFKEETDQLIALMIERKEILFIHQYNNVIESLNPLLQSSSSVTLFHFLSEFDFSKRGNQPDLERLRESLTPGFISRKSLTIQPIQISHLVRHPPQTSVEGRVELFLVRMEYLKKLTRNEVNHILLELPHRKPLIILTDNISKKWKHSLEKFPNLRYTLPYMQGLFPSQ